MYFVMCYSGEKTEEEDDIDPRVREALIQMRKFDRILEKRTRRERRVKRERIALQKRLREELDELNRERPADCKSSKDELVNTERFLTLPPSIAKYVAVMMCIINQLMSILVSA